MLFGDGDMQFSRFRTSENTQVEPIPDIFLNCPCLCIEFCRIAKKYMFGIRLYKQIYKPNSWTASFELSDKQPWINVRRNLDGCIRLVSFTTSYLGLLKALLIYVAQWSRYEGIN